jgi:hypothetical protein
VGFDANEPLFEEWLVTERERLREMAVRLGMPTQSSAGSRPWRRHQAEQRSDDDARPVRT